MHFSVSTNLFALFNSKTFFLLNFCSKQIFQNLLLIFIYLFFYCGTTGIFMICADNSNISRLYNSVSVTYFSWYSLLFLHFCLGHTFASTVHHSISLVYYHGDSLRYNNENSPYSIFLYTAFACSQSFSSSTTLHIGPCSKL